MLLQIAIFLAYYRLLGALLTVANCFTVKTGQIEPLVAVIGSIPNTFWNRLLIMLSHTAKSWWTPEAAQKAADPITCGFAFNYVAFLSIIATLQILVWFARGARKSIWAAITSILVFYLATKIFDLMSLYQRFMGMTVDTMNKVILTIMP